VHRCTQTNVWAPVAYKVVNEDGSSRYEATNDFFGNDRTGDKRGFFYAISKVADATNQRAWRERQREAIEAAHAVEVEDDEVDESDEIDADDESDEVEVDEAPEVEAPKRTRRSRKTA
jgi:hypothetical protein